VFDEPFPTDGGLTPEQLPAVVPSTWSADDAAASGMTLSNGGLTVVGSGVASWLSIRSSISKSSGKLYIELYTSVDITNDNVVMGMADLAFSADSIVGTSGTSFGCAFNNFFNGGTSGFTVHSGLNAASNSGDVIGIAIDFATGSVWFALNDVWVTGSPSFKVTPNVSIAPPATGVPLFIGLSLYSTGGGVWTLQATAASQKYAPPSGFEAWDPPMSNGPPITSAPVPPSIAGIPQPVIVSGGQSLPPSFPLGSAGSWLPPPEVGYGENTPFPTPVVPAAPVPPSVAGIPQPVFVPPGSATVPSAASMFPAFTAAGPFQPIVMVATPPPVPLPLPTTPGSAPIVLDAWGRYAGPNPPVGWPKGFDFAEAA
jgi:hypothetical protein